MVWVTWRQHRVELAAAAAVILGAVAVLVVTGVGMHEAYTSTGVPGCLKDPTAKNCDRIIIGFSEAYSGSSDVLVAVKLLPALLGAFIGAPLLARELERGTWKLAFTQSVTRARWLATELSMVALAVVALVALLTAGLTWWRGPLDAVHGRLAQAFDLEGLSLATTTLFALAVGTLVGVLVRRTVPAMALTLGAYAAVWLAVSEFLRPQYQAPSIKTFDPSNPYQGSSQPLYETDWILHTGWVDRAGHRPPNSQVSSLITDYLSQPHPVPPDVDRHLASLGLLRLVEYHPDSRFWTFQVIEAALFLGLAGTAVAATFWLLRRRTA